MATTYFFWDDLEDNIVEEYDEAGQTIADYTTEPDHFGNVISQRRGDQSSFFHYDVLGSTLAVTDESHNVTDSRAYSAFGETTESVGSGVFPFQYVGQSGYFRIESTGQYLVRRRPYDPILQRWVTLDPAGWRIGFISQYAYATNDPTGSVDLSGLSPLEIPSGPPSPGSPPSTPGPPSTLPPSDAQTVQTILDLIDGTINGLLTIQSGANIIDILAGRADICRWARAAFIGVTTSIVANRNNPLRCSVVGGLVTIAPSLAGIEAKLKPLFPRTYRVEHCNVGSCSNWLCTFSSSLISVPFPVNIPLVTPSIFGGVTSVVCSYVVWVKLSYRLEDCSGTCIWIPPPPPPYLCEG